MRSGCGGVVRDVKKIGFLSFGHWTPSEHSLVRTAADALRAVDRAGRGGGGGRGRRGLLPGAPLRPPAGVAVPAAGRGRRSDEPDRDRHCRHRHAVREPALHGRGRRRRRSHLRWPAPARHQPGIARAGDRRLPLLRPRSRRGKLRRRHGSRTHEGVPRGALRGGVRPAEPTSDVRQPAWPAACRAAFTGSAGPDLVGRRHPGHRRVDRRARTQPDELDAAHRGHRSALPPAAGRADPTVPRRLDGRRPRPGAQSLGEPQHLPDRQRPGPAAVLAGDRQH